MTGSHECAGAKTIKSIGQGEVQGTKRPTHGDKP
jgi:hypothetical protein